ncbi:MAG: GNAT family N-acetyltransferase [Candidatus Bathyarchaeia archaeon]
MKIRTYAPTDAPKLVRLLNETQRREYEFIPYSEQSFLSEVKEGNATVLVAEEKGIEGFAMLYRGEHGEELRWLCVKRGKREKEVEDLLVTSIEREARGERLFVVVDSQNVSRIADFVRRGYEVYGGLYQMTVKLTQTFPILSIPEGIVLRSLAPNEENVLIKIVNTAFKGERLRSGVIEKWKSQDPLFNEEWVHVAEINGEMVSVVVAKRDREFNEFFHQKRGYIGPVATLPNYSMRGIAKALTCKAMNFLLSKGMDSVCIYTTENNMASQALFKSLGFEVRHNWKFLRKIRNK